MREAWLYSAKGIMAMKLIIYYTFQSNKALRKHTKYFNFSLWNVSSVVSCDCLIFIFIGS